MSKTYTVSLPVAGIMVFEVEADSRRDAIDASMSMARKLIDGVEPGNRESVLALLSALEALEPHERFVEGGVSQVELDEVIVQDEDGLEVDEDDEDGDGEGEDDDEDGDES